MWNHLKMQLKMQDLKVYGLPRLYCIIFIKPLVAVTKIKM